MSHSTRGRSLLCEAQIDDLGMPFIRRLAWLPRIGLAGYALVTIGAYLIMGPYITLGWIAKGIELAIVGLVAVDLLVD